MPTSSPDAHALDALSWVSGAFSWAERGFPGGVSEALEGPREGRRRSYIRGAGRRRTRPDLRQVHLIHAELLEEVAEEGFAVAPGQLGENITTRGLDLLALSTGTVLRIGNRASVRVTGLRNPCAQIDGFADGLLKQMVRRDEGGTVVRRAGVMGVALTGGPVEPGMPIGVYGPEGSHVRLERV